MIDEKKLIEKIKERIEIHKKDYQAFKNYSGDRKIKDIAKWDECTVIIDSIKNQPKVGEWIPTSERKPDETGFYLVTIRGAKASTEFHYIKSLDSWIEYDYENQCFSDEYDVIAWQPLPEPYKE